MVVRGMVRGFAAALAVLLASAAAAQDGVLPSWNDGATRSAIIDFVARVTRDGPDHVPAGERIAVFDNDGTLWCEQPIYVQLAFALDRGRTVATTRRELGAKQPYKALLERNRDAFAATGQKGVLEIMSATHAGMTTEAFAQDVLHWIETAHHPRFNRPYTDLAYKPMQELLAYLRANGFKTFIVSGGGIEFMRPWTERVYGVPPEQVVGSSGVSEFRIGADGAPQLVKLPKIEFVDDGTGKPVGINRFIGRRPILAFGNSDGDLQMLQWVAGGAGARLTGLIHHTDDVREYAYDRKSHVGKLDKALDEARDRNWLIVDMKRDWRKVFAFEP